LLSDQALHRWGKDCFVYIQLSCQTVSQCGDCVTSVNNWIFRIKFSGLTAFVMRPGDSRPGARVFMVNALGETGKRHVPELRFDDRDWIKDIATSPWKIPLPTTRFDEAFPIATTEFDEALPKTKRRWSLGCLDLNFLPAPGVTLNQPFELDP